MCRTGPDLLAIDDPFVAVQNGSRGQGCQIAAGSGFGITLTPHHFTHNRRANELFFLLLGAHFQQRRHQHGNSLTAQARVYPHFGKFFGNNAGLDDVGFCAVAAEFFGNGAAGITVFDEQFLPVLGSLATQIVTLGCLIRIVGQKGNDFAAERVVLGAKC